MTIIREIKDIFVDLKKKDRSLNAKFLIRDYFTWWHTKNQPAVLIIQNKNHY